jgi:predicted transcriptional regulator
VTVTLRLPPELAREIDQAAARYGWTRTAVITEWLRQVHRTTRWMES